MTSPDPERGWRRVSAASAARTAVPLLVIEHGPNTPWRLVALEPATQTKHLVYDPNPGLFTRYRFGRVEVIRWTTKAGEPRTGGLYWPPDYVPGRRYPLVIQTHGFWPTVFAPSGGPPTGYAAQPLANVGIMVLQVEDPPPDVGESVREAPWLQAGVKGAIDELDRRGLIDRANVGLQGFSRTCFYSLYFLTHSSYPIAAAQLSDGVDRSASHAEARARGSRTERAGSPGS